MTVAIHPLRPENDRDGFACGDESLDRYLRQFAWQNMARHRLGVTYVAEEAGVVLGYATLVAASLSASSISRVLTKQLPRYPVPALRVARLAVDLRFRGNGIGSALVGAACDVALEMSDRVGCAGLVVDAYEDAVAFYEIFGFERVEIESGGSPVRPRQAVMFLPLSAAEAATRE